MENIFIHSILFFAFLIPAKAQIFIDEVYQDWSDVPLIVDNVNGNNVIQDFQSVQITNDNDYLYFKIELKNEILLQEQNKISLYIDIDNNTATGLNTNGIGADLSYTFGDRKGEYIINGFDYSVYHDDIELVVQPSLSSKIFEFSIKRRLQLPNGQAKLLTGDIGFLVKDLGSDMIPDNLSDRIYTIQEGIQPTIPSIELSKVGNGFRLMTYNSLFDGLFDPIQGPRQERIIAAMDADIYAFVEIYDNNSNQIANKVKNATNYQGTLYHASEGPDTHIISKYPIKDHTNIDGNGAYIIAYEGRDMLFIVAHLPAGTNDVSRQAEVDKIMAFIRDAKMGFNEFQLPKDAPIIITGDMNLYGNRRQRETLITGDILNNASFGIDAAPDWDSSDLTAALPYATGSPFAITWISNSSSFFPGRLDYTFYSDYVLELENTFALNTLLLTNSTLANFGLQSTDTEVGSDHLPIITDFTIKAPNAINEWTLTDLDIQLYPNPASDIIHIDGLSKDMKLSVTNSQGQFFNFSSTSQINIENWPNGLYLFSVYTEEGKVYSSRVSVQH